jgi:hypothetical protein
VINAKLSKIKQVNLTEASRYRKLVSKHIEKEAMSIKYLICSISAELTSKLEIEAMQPYEPEEFVEGKEKAMN